MKLNSAIGKLLKVKVLALVFLLLNITSVFASESASKATDEETFDLSELINHHIMDSHEWHFLDVKGDDGELHPVSLPLPIILLDNGLQIFSSAKFHHGTEAVESNGNYYFISHEHIYKTDAEGTLNYDEKGAVTNEAPLDFSITKNVAFLFITALLMLFVFLNVARGYKKNAGKAPSGLQSLFEPIILYIRDDVIKPNIGKKADTYTPYLLTLFFFIWFGNLLGLLPGAANLTGNIAVTAVLAIFTFLIVNFSGNKNYWKHVFYTPGVPMALRPIIMPVEIIGLFTKPFSLLIRLFVAITAGHIVILSLIALTFVFQSYAVGIGSTLLVVFINFIELIVATIQAYVFTMFSSLYIGLAVAEDHH
jgi:F-type H+-transporting ATPase subunit a